MRTIFLATAFVAATVLGSVATSASARADDLRDKRYCEIFLGYSYAAKMNQMIFNTIGFNYCPEDKVSTFDEQKLKTLAEENAADKVILNGPRHWVLDAINGGDVSGSGETKNFGGIEMTKVATSTGPLEEAGAGGLPPYTPVQVARTTIWIYDSGKAVFELTDPKGNVYVMQSYSQQVDPNLKMSDLPGLGSQLKLPAGWTYKTEILRKDLNLDAHGLATVLQDDLKDTYMLDTGYKQR
jgi:hypothetical protein